MTSGEPPPRGGETALPCTRPRCGTYAEIPVRRDGQGRVLCLDCSTGPQSPIGPAARLTKLTHVPKLMHMTSTLAAELAAATRTVVLAPADGRVAVILDGQVLGSVKDGGNIVRNADRVLSDHGARRMSGYSLNADRHLTATAYVR